MPLFSSVIVPYRHGWLTWNLLITLISIVYPFKKGSDTEAIIQLFSSKYFRVRQLMDRHYGQLTPQLMMEFLADHNNHPTGICRHYDSETPRLFNAETLASFIMVPAEGKMYLTNGTPCKSEYLEYSI
jgi:hypothetical protein